MPNRPQRTYQRTGLLLSNNAPRLEITPADDDLILEQAQSNRSRSNSGNPSPVSVLPSVADLGDLIAPSTLGVPLSTQNTQDTSSESDKLAYGNFVLPSNTVRVGQQYAQHIGNEVFDYPETYADLHADLDHEAFRSTKQTLIKSLLENPAVITSNVLRFVTSPVTEWPVAAYEKLSDLTAHLQQPRGPKREAWLQEQKLDNLRQRDASFNRVNNAFAQAEIPWHEFEDGDGEALSSDEAKNRIRAALENAALRDFFDKASLTIEVQSASNQEKIIDIGKSFFVSRPDLAVLAQAVLELDFAKTSEDLSRPTSVSEKGKTKSTDLPSPRNQAIANYLKDTKLDATDDDINDIIDDAVKNGSILDRVGNTISAYLHQSHTDIDAPEMIKLLKNGKQVPLKENKPHQYGVLLPADQDVKVATQKKIGKHPEKTIYKSPVGFVSPDPNFSLFISSIVSKHPEKLQVKTAEFVDFRLRNDNFENEVYKPLIKLLSVLDVAVKSDDGRSLTEKIKDALTPKKEKSRPGAPRLDTLLPTEKPEYEATANKATAGILVRPFLDAIMSRGLAGLGDSPIAQEAYQLLLKNRVQVSARNEDVRQYFQSFFDETANPSFENETSRQIQQKIVQDTARQVALRYFGANFDSVDVSSDMIKGMTIGVAAGIISDKKIPSNSAGAQVADAFAGGAVDAFFDNPQNAKVNTKDVAGSLGVKYNRAAVALKKKDGEKITNFFKDTFPRMMLVLGYEPAGPVGHVERDNLRAAGIGGAFGMLGSEAYSSQISKGIVDKIFREQVGKIWLANVFGGYLTGSASLFTTSAALTRLEQLYGESLRQSIIPPPPELTKKIMKVMKMKPDLFDAIRRDNLLRENFEFRLSKSQHKKIKKIIRKHIAKTAVREVTSQTTYRAQLQGLAIGSPVFGSIVPALSMIAPGVREVLQPVGLGAFPGLETFGNGVMLARAVYQFPTTQNQFERSAYIAQIRNETDTAEYRHSLETTFTGPFTEGIAQVAGALTKAIGYQHVLTDRKNIIDPTVHELFLPSSERILRGHREAESDAVVFERLPEIALPKRALAPMLRLDIPDEESGAEFIRKRSLSISSIENKQSTNIAKSGEKSTDQKTPTQATRTPRSASSVNLQIPDVLSHQAFPQVPQHAFEDHPSSITIPPEARIAPTKSSKSALVIPEFR